MDTGDHVICVDSNFHPSVVPLYTSLPMKWREYVIRDVRLGISPDCKNGSVSVLLVGVNNPPAKSKAALERGFDERRFRKSDEVKKVDKRAVIAHTFKTKPYHTV